MTGAVYHPPKPGLPFIAVIFSGTEIIDTQPVFSEADGDQWIATIVEGTKARLAGGTAS